MCTSEVYHLYAVKHSLFLKIFSLFPSQYILTTTQRGKGDKLQMRKVQYLHRTAVSGLRSSGRQRQKSDRTPLTPGLGVFTFTSAMILPKLKWVLHKDSQQLSLWALTQFLHQRITPIFLPLWCHSITQPGSRYWSRAIGKI